MRRVSVIIPMYNVEKTIEKAVLSVLRQTAYEDVQLILMNDGSKDNTDDVCCEICAKNPEILYLKQENQGLRSAVANAMVHVKTSYVMFLDADDTYAPKMVETLLTKITDGDYDCVLGGYIKCEGDKRSIALPVTDREYNKVQIHDEILVPFFEEDGNIYRRWSAPRWDKIYKTSIYNEVMKEIDRNMVYGEDLDTALRVLSKCDKVASIDYAYNYEYAVLEVSMAHHYSAKLNNQVNELIRAIRGLSIELGMTGKGMDAFEDRCTLILLTELAQSSDVVNRKVIRNKLVQQLHDPSRRWKLILQKDFPGKEFLYRLYRKIKSK